MLTFEDFLVDDLAILPDFEPPGWNNLEARFSAFIHLPHCSPLKLTDRDEIVAIGTTILHQDSAWLACIIVHERHRGKGLGILMTRELINRIDPVRYPTVLLIATDMGYPLYKKLGFITECEYMIYKSPEEKNIFTDDIHIMPYKPEHREMIMELDRECSGENRMNTLSLWFDDAYIYMHNDLVEGFYMPSLSEGMIVASTTMAGKALMKLRMNEKSVASMPEPNAAALQALEDSKWEFLRKAPRMYLGRRNLFRPEQLYNRIGGHLG